ncbi:MAG: OmpH family outer membrane protein [Rickettsiales bacterium]|nr:OmpH family outer membrane protein [Rickettsiales bacterium]
MQFSLIRTFFVLTLCMSALVMAPAISHAATTVAVVNIQKIMQKSKAAQTVREQVKSKQASFQAELDKKEKELQKEDQDLAKQRSVLSPEAFEKKYKDFRKKAAEAQKAVRTKRAKLDKGFTQALADIQKTVTDIVESISKAKSIDIAISGSQVLYASPTTDITDEVLAELDKKLPNVKVQF